MTGASSEDGSGSEDPNPVLKFVVYGLYAIVAPILVADFLAERTANHVKRNPSVMESIKTLFRSVHYVKFFTDRNRALLFVRAAVHTPAQVFGFIPGEKVINADPRKERRNRPGSWDRIRKQVYQRDDYACQCCGAQGGPDGDDVVLQADHVVPVSRGGENDMSNLRTLCLLCHQARHARLF